MSRQEKSLRKHGKQMPSSLGPCLDHSTLSLPVFDLGQKGTLAGPGLHSIPIPVLTTAYSEPESESQDQTLGPADLLD